MTFFFAHCAKVFQHSQEDIIVMKAKKVFVVHDVNAAMITKTLLIIQTDLQEYLTNVYTARMEFGHDTSWITMTDAQFAIFVVCNECSLGKCYRPDQIAIQRWILCLAIRQQHEKGDRQKNPNLLPPISMRRHRSGDSTQFSKDK
mmetsp:Transcript_95163/g.142558  ORF Transcript_95163/g.142558 Transcript_95163/m.142558 type:complete len:145 (+) Transcript_95163:271-705(+)